MRILFAVNELHIPHNTGGGPMSIHHMALTFQARGHEAAVVAALPGKGRLLGYRLLEEITKKRVLSSHDTNNGYQTSRVGYWQVPCILQERITAWRPDAVVVHGTRAEVLARVAVDHGIPVIMRYISAGSVEAVAEAADRDRSVAALLRDPLVRFVSVSQFVGAYVRKLIGVSSAVIYSPIRLADSVAQDRQPEHITFVSPVPAKGLAIALRVAALLPERRFVFVEGWRSPKAQRKELDRALAKLPNVTFRRRSLGLRDVYRSTSVLLMPSQVPEGFGRVLVEACANGIPAIASRFGGIPEALGESGVLLEASDPPERWAEAIEEILSDRRLYSRLSCSALANAQREDFQMSAIAERHLELVRRNVTRIR